MIAFREESHAGKWNRHSNLGHIWRLIRLARHTPFFAHPEFPRSFNVHLLMEEQKHGK